MKELIKNTFKSYDVDLTEKQINQFEIYYNFLIEENQKYNLTAITEPKEVVVKHFVDSVLPYKSIKDNSSLIDIGTGAGFPGIPLKIIKDDIKLTLLDSLQKRINFLNMLIGKLNLKNVITIHSRAEDYCSKTREQFDYAVSRAVASTPTLAEYLLPYVKVGGNVLMYKSEKLDDELISGQKAINVLGGKIEKIENYLLKEVESTRKILFIKKVYHTDKKYPRGKNLPKLKPIS